MSRGCWPIFCHLFLQIIPQGCSDLFFSFLNTVVFAVSGYFDDFLFPPPSSTPINIATVEAAKAKGMHWLFGSNPPVCVLCVKYVFFPLSVYFYWLFCYSESRYCWLLLHHQNLLITLVLSLWKSALVFSLTDRMRWKQQQNMNWNKMLEWERSEHK